VLQTAVVDEDTWENAAFWVHDVIVDFLDDYSLILMGYYDDLDKAIDKGLAWLKSKYPSALDNYSERN
jgi:hypothetical protein